MATTNTTITPTRKPIEDDTRRLRNIWDKLLDLRSHSMFDTGRDVRDRIALAELITEEAEKIYLQFTFTQKSN